MIWVTRLDGTPLMLNDDRILYVEAPHDTVITLAGGETLRVQESAEDIARRIAAWHRQVSGIALLEPEALAGEAG